MGATRWWGWFGVICRKDILPPAVSERPHSLRQVADSVVPAPAPAEESQTLIASVRFDFVVNDDGEYDEDPNWEDPQSRNRLSHESRQERPPSAKNQEQSSCG